MIRKLSKGGRALEQTTIELIMERLGFYEVSSKARPTLETLFSVVSYHNVPGTYQRVFLELSDKLLTVDILSTKRLSPEKEDMNSDDQMRILKSLLMQASGHGMREELVALIGSFRRLASEQALSTILGVSLAMVIKNRHDSCLETILVNGANPNIPYEDGRTALHLALEETNTSEDVIVRNITNLLAYGADFTMQDESGELPLHVAVKNPRHTNLVRKVCALTNPANFRFCLSFPNPSILSCAIQDGSDGTVEFLSDNYEFVDLDSHVSETGYTLLGLAAYRNTPLAMSLLLKRGLPLDKLSQDGSSVLYNAISSPHTEVFNYLIDIGTADNSSKLNGYKAIHQAAKIGSHTSNAKLTSLLLTGEDPNLQTADGSSALHFTMYSISSTRLLCEQQQINLDLKNKEGKIPLIRSSQRIHEISRKHSLPIPTSLVSIIKLLLERGADATSADNNGLTALHYLCMASPSRSWFDILKAIVISGGRITSKDHTGQRPFDCLLEMATKTHTWAVDTKLSGTSASFLEFVINNVPGEFLNEFGPSGMTPLTFALRQNSVIAVDFLLARQEVNVDTRDRFDGHSALETAAMLGCPERVARSILSRTQCSPYSLNVHGLSLLHFAVQERSKQTMLKLLLEDGVENLELPTRDGQTPLQLAIRAENVSAVDLLIKAGADINTHFKLQPSFYPLHLASDVGFLPVVQILVENGADVTAQLSVSEATPLHVAFDSKRARWDICSFLIQKGADLCALDTSGFTPYIAAARAKQWDDVQELMNSGMDLDLDKKDDEGWGLIDWAILHGQNSIVTKLRERGLTFSQEIRNDTYFQLTSSGY